MYSPPPSRNMVLILALFINTNTDIIYSELCEIKHSISEYPKLRF